MAGTSASGWKIADTTWIRMQQKSFTKWVQLHLNKVGATLEDLEKDFENGLLLITLAEVLSGDKVSAKPIKKCKLRIMKIQNVSLALELLNTRCRLDSISAEDVVDCNLKLILGMIWTIIQKFDIADISEEELNAKDALLLWCQKKTKKYDNVDITNFHRSWKNGLAFCAIIHAHKPNLIPYETLSAGNDAENLELAFSVAEEQLGIPRFLDVADMVESEKPDERSVMTYVSQYYKYFAAGSKGETAARRINKLIELTRANDALKEDYAARAAALAQWISDKTDHFNGMECDGTVEDAIAKLDELGEYKANEKPPKSAEKLDLEALMQSLALKLKQANRPAWVPEDGNTPEKLQELWDALEEAERLRLAALRAEKARLEKVANLVGRFNRKAAALEKWNDEKANYLNLREDIDTMAAARSALKIYDAYEGEAKKAVPRLQVVNDLGAEIVALNYAESDAVQARVDALNAAAEEQKGLAKAKSDYLWECVEREELKDAKRKEFAEKAKAYMKFCHSSKIALSDTTFGGNDLESVRGYEATLDASDAEISGQSTEQLEAIQAVAAELAELGVTDNKYTPLTVDDTVAAGASVDAAIEARREAYAAELERQEAMEAKRIEFAEAAQAFVDYLGAQRTTVDAAEGEPDAVAEAVKAEYAAGEPAEAELAKVAAIDAEARALRITSNPHTTLTLAQLRGKLGHHKVYVRNYLYELEEEERLKKDYTSRAEELVAWIDETTPKLEVEVVSGGSLDDARAGVAEFNAYRTGEKGAKAGLKTEIEALASQLDTILSASEHNRPPFAPPAEFSLETIGSKWAALVAAEEARGTALMAELDRQEQIASLVRQFDGDATEVLGWIDRKEEYLGAEAATGSVTAAQVQLVVLDAFNKDYEKKAAAKDKLLDVAAKLAELEYAEVEAVNDKAQEASERFEALAGMAAEKQETLQAALESEQAKEAARVAFAKGASDYIRWVRDMLDTVTTHEFGSNLEEVEAYAAALDADDEQVSGSNDSKRDEVLAAAAKLEELGTTATTNVTVDDIANEHASLVEAIAARRTALEAELERQNQIEAKCVEFGEAAQAFVEWADAQTKAVDEVDDEDIDARIAATEALYADGAPLAEAFAPVEALDAEVSALGVTGNKHTEYSMSQLEKKKALYTTIVNSSIENLKDEKALAERAAAQAAESAEKERLETLRIDYVSAAQAVNVWLDNLEEAVSEELSELETIEAVAEQQTEFDAAVADREAQEAAYAKCQELAAQLTEAGQDDFGGFPVAEVQAKWEAATGKIDERAEALAAAKSKQEGDQKLRDAFDAAATELDGWQSAKMAELNQPPEGELEAQLTAAKAILDECQNAGREKLVAAENAAEALLTAGIRTLSNYNIDGLRVEYDQVVAVAAGKVQDISSSIAAAASSEISPEQIDEFTQVFSHFDKSSKGALTKLEFKGALQALGDEMDDDELEACMSKTDANGNKLIELDEFLAFVSSRTVDHDSLEEIEAAFSQLTNGADVITEAQMLEALPAEEVEFLKTVMPEVDGGYDYKTWASEAFSR
ncbi:alpha-actinin A [Thecamonas trahens ATCC 50062]|uniref:Alpha-actinin A n=1 Tax=Thecamonas trahens ATCC 50062 TaxID=461836 RepID=A0A0L0DXN3_THETB|nr:alpha-actinin A [Thecamonas trahens ATCC 50062]KNC56298.1 alpha-actinin A [Thecamonas trahens ATCC 50062]|eukprot:XP_013760817.1 alpha-actinin A [Thecamonas trahens ATCC 50062]